MKKNLLNNLAFIIFGLVLAGAVSAFAVWSNPSANAPSGNIAAPVHTGPSQIKATGDCTTSNCGGLSVGPLAVFSNAEFDDKVYFNGVVRGGTSLDSNASSVVDFGSSTNSTGTTSGYVGAGNASVTGLIQDKDLASNVASNARNTLCAYGYTGKIVPCTTPDAGEVYAVGVQTLIYTLPDYLYDSNKPVDQDYIAVVCLSTAAKRPLTFRVPFSNGNFSTTDVVSIRAGQACSDRDPSTYNVVLAASSTKVPPVTEKCVYEADDPNYTGAAYQGYSVNIAPAMQCH